jgi:hypothetical protein
MLVSRQSGREWWMMLNLSHKTSTYTGHLWEEFIHSMGTSKCLGYVVASLLIYSGGSEYSPS